MVGGVVQAGVGVLGPLGLGDVPLTDAVHRADRCRIARPQVRGAVTRAMRLRAGVNPAMRLRAGKVTGAALAGQARAGQIRAGHTFRASIGATLLPGGLGVFPIGLDSSPVRLVSLGGPSPGAAPLAARHADEASA